MFVPPWEVIEELMNDPQKRAYMESCCDTELDIVAALAMKTHLCKNLQYDEASVDEAMAAALLFDGRKVANVSTWKELFQKAYERLNALDASKFDALPDDSAFSKYFIRLAEGKKTPHDCFKVKLGSRGDIRAYELANKVYLWRTDYYFRKLLDRLGVDSSRLDVL